MSAAAEVIKRNPFHSTSKDDQSSSNDEAIRTKISELKAKGRSAKASATGAQISASKLNSQMTAISASSKQVLSELEACMKNVNENDND